jgi:hypothetical protein
MFNSKKKCNFKNSFTGDWSLPYLNNDFINVFNIFLNMINKLMSIEKIEVLNGQKRNSDRKCQNLLFTLANEGLKLF